MFLPLHYSVELISQRPFLEDKSERIVHTISACRAETVPWVAQTLR